MITWGQILVIAVTLLLAIPVGGPRGRLDPILPSDAVSAGRRRKRAKPGRDGDAGDARDDAGDARETFVPEPQAAREDESAPLEDHHAAGDDGRAGDEPGGPDGHTEPVLARTTGGRDGE
jgi:hypothetical protein